MSHKLIIALDNLSPEEAKNTVQEILSQNAEYKDGVIFKIHDIVALIGFIGIAELFKDIDCKFMLDPKWNDIPNTLKNYMSQLHRSGLGEKIAYITLHVSGGANMLRVAEETKNEYFPGAKLLAITAMTSLDDGDTGLIFDDTAKHSVLKLTKIALDAGIEGIVCSTHEAQVLREVYGNDFDVVTPGVRFAGGDHGDQKRVMTPSRAIQQGATNIVMGRPILEADDISGAVSRFFKEIESVEYLPENTYSFEKMLYAGDWKEILSYIGAFYFRPNGGKYCRFTSSLVSNAYINIGAVERHYPVIERATNEMAEQIRKANMEPDIIIGAEMGSIRISLYLAEKLGVEESLYTEKDKFDMLDEKKIDGESYYRKFGNADVTIGLKRHARDLKGKKIIISEDVVSRGATIKKMIKLIKGLGGEIIAIACIANRYEQDNQDGIPIISCFIPPKFKVYWDDKTREDVRGVFPQLPEGAVVSEKPKNEWDGLVASMRK